MKNLAIVILVGIGFNSSSLAQYDSTNEADSTSERSVSWTFNSFNISPKFGVMRSVGLRNFNDDLTELGVDKLPIICFTSGIEVNLKFGNISLSLDQTKYNYNNHFNPLITGTSVLIETTEQSLYIGYDLIGKKRWTRLEPYLGIGMGTVKYSVTAPASDTVFTFKQTMQGSYNTYRETAKTTVVGIGGIRFMGELQKRMDLMIFAEYRTMLTSFKWYSNGTDLKKLGGINIGLGIVFYPSRLFPKIFDKSGQ